MQDPNIERYIEFVYILMLSSECKYRYVLRCIADEMGPGTPDVYIGQMYCR